MAEGSEQSPEPQVIYVTTIGRVSGRPREIEIWFVECDGRLYIFSEHPHKTNWLKNIKCNPRVRIRMGNKSFEAAARLLDPHAERELYRKAQRLAAKKYDWGDGLPVEITPDSPALP